MLLALVREEGDFSIGSRLPLEGADRISALARRHGFRPAAPQWQGERLTREELDRFARTVVEMRKAAQPRGDIVPAAAAG
jgi:hypothetical protein